MHPTRKQITACLVTGWWLITSAIRKKKCHWFDQQIYFSFDRKRRTNCCPKPKFFSRNQILGETNGNNAALEITQYTVIFLPDSEGAGQKPCSSATPDKRMTHQHAAKAILEATTTTRCSATTDVNLTRMMKSVIIATNKDSGKGILSTPSSDPSFHKISVGDSSQYSLP